MLDFDLYSLNWKKLSDEEQSKVCMAVADEYLRVSKTIYDALFDAGLLASMSIFHDWNRVCTNLRMYARPQKSGENLSQIRWQTMMTLHKICNFLEWVEVKERKI